MTGPVEGEGGGEPHARAPGRQVDSRSRQSVDSRSTVDSKSTATLAQHCQPLSTTVYQKSTVTTCVHCLPLSTISRQWSTGRQWWSGRQSRQVDSGSRVDSGKQTSITNLHVSTCTSSCSIAAHCLRSGNSPARARSIGAHRPKGPLAPLCPSQSVGWLVSSCLFNPCLG